MNIVKFFFLAAFYMILLSPNTYGNKGHSDLFLANNILLEFKKNELVSHYFKRSVPKNDKIQVTVKNGEAFLYGKVRTELEARRLIQLAMSVPGIIEVNPEGLSIYINVDPDLRHHLIAKAMGRINALLVEGRLGIDTEIDVDCNDDILVISGYITNQQEKQLLVNSLNDIKGVKSVDVDLLKLNEEVN